MMSFTESVRTCFKKYATLSGRASRAEFWWFILFNNLIAILLFVVSAVFMIYALVHQLHGTEPQKGAMVAFGATTVIFMLIAQTLQLALLVPNICVLVRRFHDTGHSGYEIFYALIPLVGVVYCLVLCLQPSEEGDNKYGPNPNTPIDTIKTTEVIESAETVETAETAETTV